ISLSRTVRLAPYCLMPKKPPSGTTFTLTRVTFGASMNSVPFITSRLLTVSPAVPTCMSPSWTVRVAPAGTPTPAAGGLVSVTVGPVTGAVPVELFGSRPAPGEPVGPPGGDESSGGFSGDPGADTDGPPPEPNGPGGAGLWVSRLDTETVPKIRPAAA